MDKLTKKGSVRLEENGSSQGYKLKRQKFLVHYLKTGNARASALAAGYSPRCASSEAQRILFDPWVQEQLSHYYESQRLTVEFALLRLGEQVRAEYSRFIREDGTVDIKGLKDAGLDHLIRSVDIRPDGTVRVEFYDAQKAMDMFFRIEERMHRSQISIALRHGSPPPEQEPQIVIYLPDNMRDSEQ
jgi:phage terminase small subunit